MNEIRNAPTWEIAPGPERTHHRVDGTWVRCRAEIQCVATGETRWIDTEEILDDGDSCPTTYNWEEGNFSCDCNRHLFFTNWDESVDDHECSEDAYAVNLYNALTGERYYSEFHSSVTNAMAKQKLENE